MNTLGKLIEVKDLRTIWAHEARNFTTWLANDENIAILADAVGLEIEIIEEESAVGDFKVDILAKEVQTDKQIIIENQLGDTDHDHLGKLITYAAGKEASIIIWVVKNARSEHKAAIEWLNNHTDEDISFFLCEIKLYKIGDSKPAVKFEVIEKPNEWTKEIKRSDKTKTEQQRYEYWKAFQEFAVKNQNFSKHFHQRKPSYDHWLDFSMGNSAYHISVTQVLKRNELGVEFFIVNDKNLFDSLLNNQSKIETESGLKFEWQKLPEKKASRIIIRKNFSLDDQSQWNAQFEWLIDTMVKMKTTFKKFL